MKNKEIYDLLIEHAKLAGYAIGCLEGLSSNDLPPDVKQCLKESAAEIDKIQQDVMDKYWPNEPTR